MTLTRMPNGEYVDIAAGTPPDVVERIRARYKSAPGGGGAAPRAVAAQRPVTAQEQRTRDYQRQMEGSQLRGVPVIGHAARALQSATHEASFHADDVVTSALTAATAPDVWTGKRRLQDEYSAAREGMRRFRGDMTEYDPASTAVGGLAGMVAAPTRAVGRTVMGLGGRFAPRAAEGVFAATRGPIANAAAHGALQGGLVSLADTGDVGRAAQSGVLGGLGGAVGGAVLGRVLPGVARAVTDRAAKAAERVGYDKIAAMLGRSTDDAGRPFTPNTATAEIADATQRGTPTTLGDLSPEMSGMRSELARRTSLPSAADIAAAAEHRLATAADRFNDMIRGTVKSRTGDDALKLGGAITEGRKAQAAIDYAKGGAMDRPLRPTAELVNAFSKPTPDMVDALKAARRAFANDPDLGAFTRQVQHGTRTVEVPTMRAFDEIKKAFDDLIEGGIQHLPDGSNIVSNASRAASKQLRTLKDQVAKGTPEYADLLGRQRDAFERLESLNVGKTFMDRMRRSPRELLTELTEKGARNPEEIRSGLIDALLSVRNTTGSPIKLLRSWERNPQQRAVLEYVMGGTKKFNEFSKFMRRELRAMQADELVMRGSKRPVLNDFAEHGETGPIQSGAWDVLRGQAYGGTMGAVSAASRAVDRLRTGMGDHAQEATLRLLGSDGRGLAEGVASARAVREARRAAAMQRARAAGRVAGTGAAAVSGSGE